MPRKTLPERPQIERASKRFKVFEPAAMRWAGQERRIHLLDLSLTGARAYCDKPPGQGELVAITCGALECQGRISWVDEGRFGIRFDAPVDDAVLARIARLA